MTKTQLLSTVAASLLLSVGIASAQSPNTQAPARAPAAQQSAPAEKVAPPMKAGERKEPATTGQAAHEKAGAATTGQSPKESSGEMKGKPAERGGAEMKTKPDERGGINMKSDKHGPPEVNTKSTAADKHGPPDVKQSAGEKSGVTTGQGAAAGSAKLSTEQRTKITTIIKRQKVQPTRLNVSINIGTRIPANVHFYTLPVEVVTVYPEWRGYDYILVGDQIVIVNPRTHEIVAIIDA